MSRLTKCFIRVLVLVLASGVVAHADPITYSLSGQIRYLGGAWEDFEGSFLLSDEPTIEYFTPGDSRGAQRDRFTFDALTVTSASYTLTGTGRYVATWDQFDRFNPIDSDWFFVTSGGNFESPAFDCCVVGGTPGTAPTDITARFMSYHGAPYLLANVTAVRSVGVPEPSTFLVYSLGVLGLAAFRRRR